MYVWFYVLNHSKYRFLFHAVYIGEGVKREKAVQTSQRTDQELSSVQFLTITAAFVALTYIFTAFINVKLTS